MSDLVVCDWCAVKLFGGTVLAVAVICDCLVLGSGCGALTRSSSCLAAGCNEVKNLCFAKCTPELWAVSGNGERVRYF